MDEKITASTTMSAEAYARLCEHAEREGITPEQLLARLVLYEMSQRSKQIGDQMADEMIRGTSPIQRPNGLLGTADHQP